MEREREQREDLLGVQCRRSKWKYEGFIHNSIKNIENMYSCTEKWNHTEDGWLNGLKVSQEGQKSCLCQDFELRSPDGISEIGNMERGYTASLENGLTHEKSTRSE